MSDHRPVLFNFFDVVAFGIVLAFGVAAIVLIGAKSVVAAVLAFTIGASIPIAVFVILGRMLRRKRGENDAS